MRENFDKSIAFVLRWEGGYSNDSRDAGGETNFGISKRYHADVDIKNLTKDGAKEIYLNEYWLPNGCDELEYPMDIVIFNAAVNPGTKFVKSAKDIDGNWKDFLLKQIEYYAGRPSASTYLKGWTNRTIALYNFIIKEN